MIHDCEDIIRETAGEEGVQYARNVWLDSLIDAPVSNNMQTWIDTAIEINMFFPGTLHSLLNTWERTYQAEVEFLDILQRQATD